MRRRLTVDMRGAQPDASGRVQTEEGQQTESVHKSGEEKSQRSRDREDTQPRWLGYTEKTSEGR